MKKKTNRIVHIYPRVTVTNRKWLSSLKRKFKLSESEIIDSLLAHSRSGKGFEFVAKT